ncbi:hypothetical protein ThimaDRAFT_4868, partial [Thiocapsa marina 5811]
NGPHSGPYGASGSGGIAGWHRRSGSAAQPNDTRCRVRCADRRHPGWPRRCSMGQWSAQRTLRGIRIRRYRRMAPPIRFRRTTQRHPLSGPLCGPMASRLATTLLHGPMVRTADPTGHPDPAVAPDGTADPVPPRNPTTPVVGSAARTDGITPATTLLHGANGPHSGPYGTSGSGGSAGWHRRSGSAAQPNDTRCRVRCAD